MSTDFLKFGTVFRLADGSSYVFLMSSSDTFYAARILSKDSAEVRALIEKERVLSGLLTPQNYERLRKPAFCYVVLTTEDFCDDIAHFGGPGENTDRLNDEMEVLGVLNRNDLLDLKKHIELSDEVLSQELVSSVRMIVLGEQQAV